MKPDLILYCSLHDKVLKNPECECSYDYRTCWHYLVLLPSQVKETREAYRKKKRI